MRRNTFYTIGVFSVVLSAAFAASVYAETNSSVNISNNAEGSQNTVEINNNSDNGQTNTHVRIESNGQVKEYNSDQPGDVTIQSDDGKSVVRINNSGSSSNTNVYNNNGTPAIQPTPKSSAEIQKQINEKKAEAEKKKEEVKQKVQEQRNFLQQLMDSINNFLTNLDKSFSGK